MPNNTVTTLRILWLRDIEQFWGAFMPLNEEDSREVVESIWQSVVDGKPGFKKGDRFKLISFLAHDYLS